MHVHAVTRMAEASKAAFEKYLIDTFPIDGKRGRSAVIRRSLAKRIVGFLKNESDGGDKAFRHFVKKSGFQLVDLPAAGVRDVLVSAVKEDKQVRAQCCSGVVYNRYSLQICQKCSCTDSSCLTELNLVDNLLTAAELSCSAG